MNTLKTADHATPAGEFFSAEHAWLEDAFQRVKSAFDADKMAHGMLTVAPVGSGKRLLVESLAKSILCRESGNKLLKACGKCKNCSLVEAASHPDLFLIDCLIDNKGKQKKSIGIDQVRQLSNKLAETPQLNGWRIAIIKSVEKMTRGAFNAILKTLEEPGDKTLLLMVANSAHQVPATIKSRCQMLNLNLAEANVLPWLVKAMNCEIDEAQQALHLPRKRRKTGWR